jgi:hypothetical protein
MKYPKDITDAHVPNTKIRIKNKRSTTVISNYCSCITNHYQDNTQSSNSPKITSLGRKHGNCRPIIDLSFHSREGLRSQSNAFNNVIVLHNQFYDRPWILFERDDYVLLLCCRSLLPMSQLQVNKHQAKSSSPWRLTLPLLDLRPQRKSTCPMMATDSEAPRHSLSWSRTATNMGAHDRISSDPTIYRPRAALEIDGAFQNSSPARSLRDDIKQNTFLTREEPNNHLFY